MKKCLWKKCLGLTMIFTMLLQMTEIVSAAYVDWEENGYYYSAYVNKDESVIYDFVLDRDTHTYGTQTVLTVAPQTVTVTMDAVFPNDYRTYLNSCVINAGLNLSYGINISAAQSHVVPAASSSGTYVLIQRFYGYNGNWGVKGSSNPEGPRTNVINETTFSFAPTGVESTPIWYKIS